MEVMWGLLSVDVGLWEYAYNYVFKGICIWMGEVRVGVSMWVRGRVGCVWGRVSISHSLKINASFKP